mgnify:CR=1 FL=1
MEMVSGGVPGAPHFRDGLAPEDLIPDTHQVLCIMGVFSYKSAVVDDDN